MRAWLIVFAVVLTGCPKLATENERCGKTPDCVAGLTCCGGACIDVQKDPRHCGACGETCAEQNAIAACLSGVCRLSCKEGFADCNTRANDGCEVNVRADPASCGACGRACTTANATPACSAGQCVIGGCSGGYANCDGSHANGCEVTTGTDAMNCGACGMACALPNATARCNGARCVIGACEAGRGDCDGLADTGCETDTRVSPMHCGVCGRACTMDQLCALGECRTLELYLFGGRADPTSPPTNAMLKLQLGQRSFSTVTVAAPNGAPPARAFHVSAWDEAGTRMLVLGGAGFAGPVSADLWALSLAGATPTWELLATTGTRPGPSSGLAAGWDRLRRRWYVFGGEPSAGAPTADLFVLDVATLTWSQLTVAGTTPPARAFAAAMFDDDATRFVVHGGLGAGATTLGDTWVFDPMAMTWTSAAMSGPGPRAHATFLAGASPPVLFGGANGVAHFDDLWELDPVAGTWAQRAAPAGPPQRRHAAGLTIGGLRSVVSGVFDDGAAQTLYNDVWLLTWPARAWQQVRSNTPVGAANARVGFTAVARQLP